MMRSGLAGLGLASCVHFCLRRKKPGRTLETAGFAGLSPMTMFKDDRDGGEVAAVALK